MVDVNALARQVKELAGEVSGEKIVTRHLLDKLSANTEILLDIRRELTTLNQKMDKQADAIALLGAHQASFEAKFAGIAGDELRKALKEVGNG